jgi:hypothetical protein
VLFLRKRTEPSQNRALAPPGWSLLMLIIDHEQLDAGKAAGLREARLADSLQRARRDWRTERVGTWAAGRGAKGTFENKTDPRERLSYLAAELFGGPLGRPPASLS